MKYIYIFLLIKLPLQNWLSFHEKFIDQVYQNLIFNLIYKKWFQERKWLVYMRLATLYH